MRIMLCFLKQKVFFFTQFRTDIARTEYLSNADERLRWQANSLPADDLCTENAIMLKRFNRYLRERKTLWSGHEELLKNEMLHNGVLQISSDHWSVGSGHRVHHERIQRKKDHSHKLFRRCLQEEFGECSEIWQPSAGAGILAQGSVGVPPTCCSWFNAFVVRFAGCGELRPHTEPSAQQRGAQNRRPRSHHPRRSGHRFVSFLCHFPLYARPHGSLAFFL